MLAQLLRPFPQIYLYVNVNIARPKASSFSADNSLSSRNLLIQPVSNNVPKQQKSHEYLAKSIHFPRTRSPYHFSPSCYTP